MVECLDLVGYACNLVNLVIIFLIKDSQPSICTHSLRSIILYIVCIMSFIWRTGVTSTTPPGLSDTGLLVIRIVMTVVLGIGVLYGFLILITFQRYGTVMDKAWKQRIDEWIGEKATGNNDPDHLPYSPRRPHRYYPDRPLRYPTHNPSRYYQPSFGDVNGRYPRYGSVPEYSPSSSCGSTPPTRPYTYTPAYAPPTVVGSAFSTPSSKSDDAPTISRPGRNQATPQLELLDPWFPYPSFGDVTSAAHIPRPGNTTPPTLNPNGPVTPAEELPPRPIPIPERTLYPIVEASTTPSEDEGNALGFSSGLKNRSGGGDEAPDDGNHVRFRLPSGSSDISDDWQGILGSRKPRPRKPPKR